MDEKNHTDTVVLAGVDLQALLDLSRQLSDVPEAAAAIQVALQSGQLEDFFRLMRERAQAIARGLDAKAALAVMTPAAPEAAPPPPRKIAEETTRADAADARERGGPPTDEPSLADFFRSVTNSIVAAQTSLDERSLAYARQLKGTPLAPLHFSIPNVHAEVKMGFNVSDRSNLIVRLFGKPEDTTNYGESTVSFDVAASPPPPGSDFASPIPMFLVVDAERTRVLESAGVPEAQRPAAVVIKNAADRKLSVEGTVYIALVPHDNVVSIYHLLRDEKVQRQEVPADDAAKALTDLAAVLNGWLESVAPPPPAV